MVIDLPGGFLKQFAGGIVGDGGQVDHRLDAREMLRSEFPAILDHDLQRIVRGEQVAPEEEAVDRPDGVARFKQKGDQDRTDIPARTRNQNPFQLPFPLTPPVQPVVPWPVSKCAPYPLRVCGYPLMAGVGDASRQPHWWNVFVSFSVASADSGIAHGGCCDAALGTRDGPRGPGCRSGDHPTRPN